LRSNCYLYLHGHSAGGTNPSIVEAMNLSLPIIAYDVSYNRESTENSALFFRDADELERIVKNIDEATIEKLSYKMKGIANRRYTWKVIADKYRKMMLPESVKKVKV